MYLVWLGSPPPSLQFRMHVARKLLRALRAVFLAATTRIQRAVRVVFSLRRVSRLLCTVRRRRHPLPLALSTLNAPCTIVCWLSSHSTEDATWPKLSTGSVVRSTLLPSPSNAWYVVALGPYLNKENYVPFPSSQVSFSLSLLWVGCAITLLSAPTHCHAGSARVRSTGASKPEAPTSPGLASGLSLCWRLCPLVLPEVVPSASRR